MDLSRKNIDIYRAFNFAARYKALIDRFGERGDFRYENETVKHIFISYGYDPKYYKSEDFFQVELVKTGGLRFRLNISLKYNSLELIMTAVDLVSDNYIVGGPSGAYYKAIMNEEESTKLDENERKVALFSSYDELEEILKESLAIYEDFKREVIKVYGKENNKKEEE